MTTLMSAVWGLALLLAGTQQALAAGFDEADRLFAAREGNAANVGAARAAYQDLVPVLTGDDLAYALQQIGRLAIYEGTYLLDDASGNRARKASLFDGCRKGMVKLADSPAHVSTYAYWRMTCTAQWMKYASVSDRLAELPETKRYFNVLIDEALEIKPDLGLDVRYQGGGMPRVLAGVFSNSMSSLIRDGLPNGAKALEMADRGLRARAFPGDANQGADYYRNHRQKAEVLIFLGRTADAKALLAATIAEIEELAADDDLPEGLEPETRGELTLMRAITP